MADFFELQDQARAKTRTLVGYFILAVTLIVLAVNLAVWFACNVGGIILISLDQWPLHYYSWITTAVVLGLILITSAIQSARLSGGGDAVAKMVGATRILPGTKDKHERRLLNITEEMSIASGMPMPKVFVMEDESGINAFVAGLKPSLTVLVVTYGTLKKLSRDELQGVIGHEFSHIFNADMNINVRLMGILAGILVIGQMGYGLMRILGRSRMGFSSRGSSRSSNSGANILLFIVVLGAALFAIGYIGLFFGRLIKASISRQREYLADASSVQYTRDADGITKALAHIQLDSTKGLLHNKHAEDMSHMCFDMPISLSLNGLLATHPPLPDRIKAISPNFSIKDYRPKKGISKDFSSSDKPASKIQSDFQNQTDVVGFSGSSHQFSGDDASFSENLNSESSSNHLVDAIGKPNPENLANAAVILSQIPSDILEQSNQDSIKAQLVIYALLVHAEPEDKKQINQYLETQLPRSYFKLYLIWAEQLLNLSGWVRLPLLNHVIPVLQLCSNKEKNLFFNTVLTIIKNNKQVNLSEYILYALLKKRLQTHKAKMVIPSLVEVKPELGLIFSLMVKAGYNDPVIAKQQYQQIMQAFAIGIFANYSDQKFNAVSTHNALIQLSRLSPFLKRNIITSLGDCINHNEKVSVDEFELLRAICDYLDCPLPPLKI